MKQTKYLYLAILAVIFMGCDPEEDDKIDIGGLPTASFDIASGDTPNDFVLINTSPETFLTKWTVEGNGSYTGDMVELSVPRRGEYAVEMTTLSAGGSATASQMLVVEQDDPNACTDIVKLLSGCDQKAWKLAPEAAALHVGPSLFETWWASSDSDVIDRACQFNDEYIFTSDGQFIYDSNGDIFADSDANGTIPSDLGISAGCHPTEEWPEQYAAWSDNTHSYIASATELTVDGLGAYMGLYKVATSAEVTTPQSSVTYNIETITEDRMVLWVNFGPGIWRFTFISE